MAFLQILEGASPTGEQTVPDALLGCWRRNWIRFGSDGELERQVHVIWLQTSSGMGDVRIDPTQLPHETDSSCGITRVDETTSPHPTADWHDGPHGFAQQPVSNFPEKGWLAWDSPSIMRELAPSGAYVEEWERLGDSTSRIAHLRAPDAPTTTNLYVAGAYVMLCIKAPHDGLHEFSWGRYCFDTEQVEVKLSTVSERVGQKLDLTQHRWQIESYRET